MNKYKIAIIIIDVFAVCYLIYQIIKKEVYIPSYVILVIVNFLIFLSKEEEKKK